MVVGDKCPAEWYLVVRAGTYAAHAGLPFLQYVTQYLRQLGILIQVHQVGLILVHLKGDSSFLGTWSESFGIIW